LRGQGVKLRKWDRRSPFVVCRAAHDRCATVMPAPSNARLALPQFVRV